MSIATAITIVGIAAVAAAWTVAMRWLGRREDAARVSRLEARVAEMEASAREGDDLRGIVVAQARAHAELDDRVNKLAAHAAFIRGTSRQRGAS